MTAPRALRPTVDPRDSYAGAPQGNAFSQIAQSLSGLNASLDRFTARQAQVASEGDRERGRELARQLVEGGKSWAQAIKEKPELAAISGWVKMGVEETYGTVAGGRFTSDLRDFAERNLSSATSLEEVDAAMGKYLEEWRKQNIGERPSQFFEESFFNQAQAAINNTRNALVGVAAKNAGEVQLAGLFEKTRLKALEAFEAYRETGDISLIEAAAASINADQDAILQTNPTIVRQFNKKLTEALNVATREVNDIALRTLFGARIKGGTGKLGDTQEFLQADNGRLQTDAFLADTLDRMTTMERLRELKVADEVRGLEEQLVSAILKGEPTTGVMRDIALLQPKRATELQGLVESVDDLGARDDASTAEALANELYVRKNYGGFARILASARKRKEVSKESYVTWLMRLESLQSAARSQSGAPKDVTDFPYYRNWKASVEKFEVTGSGENVAILKSRFDRLTREWFAEKYMKNPQMAEGEVEQSFARLFDQAVRQTYRPGSIPQEIAAMLRDVSGQRSQQERFKDAAPMPPELQRKLDAARRRGVPDLNLRMRDPSVQEIVRDLTAQGKNFDEITAILAGTPSASASPQPGGAKPSSGSKNE